MKILHIGNIAGIASTFASIQKELGHEAAVFSFSKHALNFPPDYGYYNLQNIPVNFLRNVKIVLKLFPKYEIYHFHAKTLLPNCADLVLWNKIGKRIILHHHGSDIRNRRESRIGLKYSTKILVSTPDLMRWSPSATWLPNPLDISGYSYVGIEPKDITEEFKIVHAPTNREVKGTRYIVAAINDLIKEGYNIDFTLLENKSHTEVLEAFKSADIVVDQLLLGWYGMVSLEAMALGKPVCTFIDEELIKYLPFNPVYNCNPLNVKQKLQYIIENEDVRRVLSERGRRYVLETHEAKRVTSTLISEYYHNLA